MLTTRVHLVFEVWVPQTHRERVKHVQFVGPFCRWKHVIVECGTGPSVIILDPIHSNQRPGRLAIYACWSSIASAAEWRTIGPFLVHFRCQELCKIVSSCRRRCESARTHLKPSLTHSVWQNRLLLMYTVAIWYTVSEKSHSGLVWLHWAVWKGQFHRFQKAKFAEMKGTLNEFRHNKWLDRLTACYYIYPAQNLRYWRAEMTERQ